MPTICTLMVCLLLTFPVKAQSAAFLAADQVNVRVEPDSKSKILTKLSIGAQVEVLDELPDLTLTIRGHEAPWNLISFQWEGIESTGYIWSGFLTRDRILIDSASSLNLLTRPVAVKKQEYYDEITYQIRVEQSGKELARLEFEGIGSIDSYTGVDQFDNRGLSGIKNVFNFEFSDDVCGGAFGRVVVFWDGSDLHFVQRQQEGADAPVWSEQYFIYPADENGIENTLIQVDAYGDVDGDENEIEERTEVGYTWTGKKLVKK